MAKMIDCTECDGEGKVPVTGYRDNPAMTEEPQTNWLNNYGPRITHWIKKYGPTITWTFALGAAIGAVVLGGPKACDSIERSERLSRYNNNSYGKVVIEYGSDGKPIKCFVEQGDTYVTRNPTREIAISDRHNDRHIDEVAKWLDWPDGKTCVRFFYDFDEK